MQNKVIDKLFTDTRDQIDSDEQYNVVEVFQDPIYETVDEAIKAKIDERTLLQFVKMFSC